MATARVRSMIGKWRLFALAGLTLMAVDLAACLGPTPSPTPTRSPTPTARPTSGISAIPTSIDACSLLTVEQASALNGVPYKGGGTDTLSNGLSVCDWDNAAAQATVEVGFSYWPSAAAAHAAYGAALSKGTPAGSTVTPLAGLADAAVIARWMPMPSAPGVGNIFVRRDALFLTVGYYNGTIPTDAALEAAATLILGELPHVAR